MKTSDKNQKIINGLSEFCRISSDVPLADYTTFRTGGSADLFIEPHDEKSAAEALRIITEVKMPLFIMGGGSNLLISDKGLRGAVLKLSDKSFKTLCTDETIYASAFIQKEDFMSEVIKAGYGGVEFMAGIPGTIGGGIFMNAGTYMGTFTDVVKKIRIALPGGEISEIEMNSELSTYRQMNIPGNSLILGAHFCLPLSDSRKKTAQSVHEIIEDRHQKHPMEYPSAGSVFKNPEGHSSWKLVNDSGLKGFSIGGAMISKKHTNFIINTGNATSRDIYRLIAHTQKTVNEKFGVALETEIKMVGQF